LQHLTAQRAKLYKQKLVVINGSFLSVSLACLPAPLNSFRPTFTFYLRVSKSTFPCRHNNSWPEVLGLMEYNCKQTLKSIGNCLGRKNSYEMMERRRPEIVEN
jgi:hypothetical protein